jgi:hypothetical protein
MLRPEGTCSFRRFYIHRGDLKMEGLAEMFATLVVLAGVMLLAAAIIAVYCIAMIWSLNYIGGTAIGYFDLWAWLALIVLTACIKIR